jgi:hypothetical protein
MERQDRFHTLGHQRSIIIRSGAAVGFGAGGE